MATVGNFPERAAHLSYVAPLIGSLVLAQGGFVVGALALALALTAGGLAAAVIGMRHAQQADGRGRLAARIGLAANLVFLGAVVVSYASPG